MIKMEQRCEILIHLIEHIRVPLDRTSNLAAISQSASALLNILQCHHNLMLNRIEIGKMPRQEDDHPHLINLSISALLVEGVDLRQRTHAYCLEELCKVLCALYYFSITSVAGTNMPARRADANLSA